ncbi:hypothetical protein, partial [Serratia marcescens]|uniref:hypothetical protein n=1 Tax=Serratia marcescens TaxID=615 RepID=UPI0019543F0C
IDDAFHQFAAAVAAFEREVHVDSGRRGLKFRAVARGLWSRGSMPRAALARTDQAGRRAAARDGARAGFIPRRR